MLERLTLNLSTQEKKALQKIAETEMRDLRDQARFIIRRELKNRGFLVEYTNNENQGQNIEGEQLK